MGLLIQASLMSVPRVIDNQHGDFLLSIFGSSIRMSPATSVKFPGVNCQWRFS